MSSNDAKKVFLELYESTSDQLFRYCLFKISDREKSVDLVQDSFVRLWQQMIKEQVVENPRALLFKIANNLIIDLYRKKKSSSLDDMAEWGFDVADDTLLSPEIKLDSELLLTKLNSLEGSYKEVVLLRYVENLSVKEIAEILGEKENTVSVRIHRAIEKLQILFKANNE